MKASYRCSCGTELSFEIEGGTSDSAIERVGQLRQHHIVDCKYWELRSKEVSYYNSSYPTVMDAPVPVEGQD